MSPTEAIQTNRHSGIERLSDLDHVMFQQKIKGEKYKQKKKIGKKERKEGM